MPLWTVWAYDRKRMRDGDVELYPVVSAYMTKQALAPFTITTVSGTGSFPFNVNYAAQCFRRNITPASGSPTYNWYVVDAAGQVVDSNQVPGQGFMVFADEVAPYEGNLTFYIINASADIQFTVALWIKPTFQTPN